MPPRTLRPPARFVLILPRSLFLSLVWLWLIECEKCDYDLWSVPKGLLDRILFVGVGSFLIKSKSRACERCLSVGCWLIILNCRTFWTSSNEEPPRSLTSTRSPTSPSRIMSKGRMKQKQYPISPDRLYVKISLSVLGNVFFALFQCSSFPEPELSSLMWIWSENAYQLEIA